MKYQSAHIDVSKSQILLVPLSEDMSSRRRTQAALQILKICLLILNMYSFGVAINLTNQFTNPNDVKRYYPARAELICRSRISSG